MNCYFCNSKLELEAPSKRWHKSCSNCQNLHNVKVFTTFDDNKELLYAHIYVDSGNEYRYHIRLHLKENLTKIADVEDEDTAGVWEYLFTLPGFPIKPENAKEKVSLYLLFS